MIAPHIDARLRAAGPLDVLSALENCAEAARGYLRAGNALARVALQFAQLARESWAKSALEVEACAELAIEVAHELGEIEGDDEWAVAPPA